MIANKLARGDIREYMKRHHIKTDDERADLPISLPKRGLIQIRGSAHIGSGQVVTGKFISKKFKKAKF